MRQDSTPQLTKVKDVPEITGDVLIADLVENYPQVVDYLITEYGFHCVNCFVSGFEILEDGARVHGIEGEEFEEMIANINKVARGELELTF